MSRPRVVIVGAGFGGLWAARELAGRKVDVVLLDRNNYHTFYPLLYQIGAAEIDATEICYPVRKILRGQENARFVMSSVEEVDPGGRVVRTGAEEIRWDHLILATGSDPHYFGVDGAAEHAFPLKEVEEGLALRNHVLSCFERADREAEAARRRPALTFVIVGGGPTGVEYAGALAELVHGPLARDHPRLAGEEVSIVLVEALDRLLAGMPDRLGRYAARRLRSMGVEVRTEAAVEEVTARGALLAGGEEIPSETVVWTAGVQGDPDAAHWGLPVGRGGRVEVEETLQVPGHARIQVVGDLAGFEADGELLPQVAPVATQQGTHAARNVLRALEGREPEPFRYRDKGMLATVGRNHAVAHVFGRAFTGFAAWLLWIAVHIAKLVGFRNRVVVLTNWAWDYFTYERFARLILPLGEAARLEGRRSAQRTGPEGASPGLGDDPGREAAVADGTPGGG